MSRTFILLSWLALGSLLAAPFRDFIRLIQDLSTLFNPFQLGSPPETAFLFGLSSFQTQILLNLLQIVAVYAFVLWIGWRFYQEGKLGFLDRTAPARLDRVMILLTFAALVNGVMEQVVFRLMAFLTPAEDFGSISSYLVGWGVLFLLFVLLNAVLTQRLARNNSTES